MAERRRADPRQGEHDAAAGRCCAASQRHGLRRCRRVSPHPLLQRRFSLTGAPPPGPPRPRRHPGPAVYRQGRAARAVPRAQVGRARPSARGCRAEQRQRSRPARSAALPARLSPAPSACLPARGAAAAPTSAATAWTLGWPTRARRSWPRRSACRRWAGWGGTACALGWTVGGASSRARGAAGVAYRGVAVFAQPVSFLPTSPQPILLCSCCPPQTPSIFISFPKPNADGTMPKEATKDVQVRRRRVLGLLVRVPCRPRPPRLLPALLTCRLPLPQPLPRFARWSAAQPPAPQALACLVASHCRVLPNRPMPPRPPHAVCDPALRGPPELRLHRRLAHDRQRAAGVRAAGLQAPLPLPWLPLPLPWLLLPLRRRMLPPQQHVLRL